MIEMSFWECWYILILAGMTNAGAYVVHDYNSDGLVGFQEDAWLTCFDLLLDWLTLN